MAPAALWLPARDLQITSGAKLESGESRLSGNRSAERVGLQENAVKRRPGIQQDLLNALGPSLPRLGKRERSRRHLAAEKGRRLALSDGEQSVLSTSLRGGIP